MIAFKSNQPRWFIVADLSETSFNVDQETRHIQITTFATCGYQKKASVETLHFSVERSDDGTQIFIRGEVDCRNWARGKCSGSQEFCYAVFVGDSGHVYIHRAPATKGWMNAEPGTIRKRLRKLGIGAKNVIQQGDFLLKPANDNAFEDEYFKHENMGSGHYKFDLPQLFNRGQYWIKEKVWLRHTATDGIQHPDIIANAVTMIF